MQHHVFMDDDITYTRISKMRARGLWGKVDIALCPVNFRPGRPWAPHMVMRAEEIREEEASEYEFVRKRARFDTVVRSFEMYNCHCNETGHYTAFYLMKKVA